MSRVVEWLKGIWKKIKYEINYPESSENVVVREYLRRKKAIVTRRNFFSPSKDEIDALYQLYHEIDHDETLDYKEREALFTIIAYPGWFLIER